MCLLLLFASVFSSTHLVVCFSVDKVETLTSANFDEKVLQSHSGKWFVKFYAPVCISFPPMNL